MAAYMLIRQANIAALSDDHAVAINRTTSPTRHERPSLGLQALSIARDTGSARIMRELRTLGAQLTERWPSHPESRAFRDALFA